MTTQPPIHSKVWLACAGAAVKIPKIGSCVYYFPSGHRESLGFPSIFSVNDDASVPIQCIVSSVDLLSDTITDECFVKFLLSPVQNYPVEDEVQEGPFLEEDNTVVSFAKVLTKTHCNNGSAFVPIFVANAILPPLSKQEPAYQELSIHDLHGKVWTITHTRSAHRDLFTTGWTLFINAKKLMPGDSIVFIKDSNRNVIFGIRRARRLSRNLSENSFLEIVHKAEHKIPFEIDCFSPNFNNFIVDARMVENSMRFSWTRGTRVKLNVESTSLEGTISGVSVSASNRFPWKMLQVRDDKSRTFHINPWEVEVKDTGSAIQGARQSELRSFKLFGKVINLTDSNKASHPSPEIQPSVGLIEGSSVVGVIDRKVDSIHLVTVTIGSEELRGILYEAPQNAALPTSHHSASANNNVTASVGVRRLRRKTSELKTRDPAHPKPNRSGYNFFFAEQHSRLKPLNQGRDIEISRTIGELWNKLNKSEKAVYQDKAVKDKERYRTEMEYYREKLKMDQVISDAVPLQQRFPEPDTDMLNAEADSLQTPEESSLGGSDDYEDDKAVEKDYSSMDALPVIGVGTECMDSVEK